jgi:hypothetical protein
MQHLAPRAPIGAIATSLGEAAIHTGRYPIGAALYIHLSLASNPRGTWTFSLNPTPLGARLAENEFAVKTWGENEEVVAPLRASGLLEDTGRRFTFGHLTAPIWRVKQQAHLPPAPARSRSST